MAVMYFKKHVRKKSVIIVMALANIPTVVGAVMLYLVGQGKIFGGPISEALPNINLGLAKPFFDSFMISTAILAALVGPPAIAGEKKLGAPLFHLLRPMNSRQFFLGHWVAITTILLSTATIPMLLLFVFARMVIPPELLVGLPWVALFRVLAAGLTVAGFLGLSVVTFSILMDSGRGATVIWLLAYFGSDIVAEILSGRQLGISQAECAGFPGALQQIVQFLLMGESRFDGCGLVWMGFPVFVIVLALVVLTRGVRAVERR